MSGKYAANEYLSCMELHLKKNTHHKPSLKRFGKLSAAAKTKQK